MVWNKLAPKYDHFVTFTKDPLLRKFQKAEKRTLFSLISREANNDNLILIEIGCGTSRLLFRLIKSKTYKKNALKIKFIIGIDDSDSMYTISSYEKDKQMRNKKFPNDIKSKLKILKVNAGEWKKLEKKIKNNVGSKNYKNCKKIVFCILNTLGIMHPNERKKVIYSMAKIAGNNGILFISTFNAGMFKSYAPRIYDEIKDITGFFDDNSFDSINNDFISRDYYYSHWFNFNEIKDDLNEYVNGKINTRLLNDIGIITVARIEKLIDKKENKWSFYFTRPPELDHKNSISSPKTAYNKYQKKKGF